MVLAAVVAMLLCGGGTQPVVKATAASIVTNATSPATATALVTLENGTMYDVYLISATTDVAEAIEIRQKPQGAGAAALVKEVAVPSFGQLEMAAEGVHLALVRLKRRLEAGESIPLSLVLDNGTAVSVQAVVK